MFYLQQGELAGNQTILIIDIPSWEELQQREYQMKVHEAREDIGQIVLCHSGVEKLVQNILWKYCHYANLG